LVTDELVDDPVVLDEDARRDLIEPIQELAERRRAHPLRQRRRPTNVREQEARLELGAAVVPRQHLEACAAVVGVLLPRPATLEAHQKAARWPERRGAHLAAR